MESQGWKKMCVDKQTNEPAAFARVCEALIGVV